MKKLEDDMWAGKNVSGNMHFFETGAATNNSKWFFALMPKIVAFHTLRVYDDNKDFFDDVIYSTMNIVDTQKTVTSWRALRLELYKRYKNRTFYDFKEDIAKTEIKMYLDLLDKNKGTIIAILGAVKRAVKQYGYDLHAANLGFFEQQPDKLFFFDM